jgi:hypothetical protein
MTMPYRCRSATRPSPLLRRICYPS